MIKYKSTGKIRLAVAGLLLIGGLHFSYAQIPLPGGDDDVEDAPSAPIDGLLGVGLLTGIIYGVRKIRKK